MIAAQAEQNPCAIALTQLPNVIACVMPFCAIVLTHCPKSGPGAGIEPLQAKADVAANAVTPNASVRASNNLFMKASLARPASIEPGHWSFHVKKRGLPSPG